MRSLQLKFFVVTFLALGLIVVVCIPEASSRPNVDEMVNMAEALRYLEQLDKYYAQIARPRFGRSIRNKMKADSMETNLD